MRVFRFSLLLGAILVIAFTTSEYLNRDVDKYEEVQIMSKSDNNSDNNNIPIIKPSESSAVQVTQVTTNKNTTNKDITDKELSEAPAESITTHLKVDAGYDQSDWEGATFTLQGFSSNAINQSLKYSWSQTDSSGISVFLTDSDTNIASFTADEVEFDTELTFTFTVEDKNGEISTDTMQVVVNNLVIDDPSLRSCVSKLSGVELYQLERFDCREVDLSKARFSELTKLEKLTSLELIDSNIEDITELSDLISLTNLSLAGNNLTDIRYLSGLTSLKVLHVGGNKLTNVTGLSGLTSLTNLHLGDNQLTDVTGLSGLSSLRDLHLGDNKLTDVMDLSGLSALTNLNLNENRLTNVTGLSGLPSLKVLHLSDNQLIDVTSLSGLSALTNLTVWGNKLTSLAGLSGIPSLTNLHVSNNQLTDITDLSGLTSLRYLDLMSNCLTDFSFLPSDIKYLNTESQKVESRCNP